MLSYNFESELNFGKQHLVKGEPYQKSNFIENTYVQNFIQILPMCTIREQAE